MKNRNTLFRFTVFFFGQMYLNLEIGCNSNGHLFYSAAKDIQKALQEPLSEMYGVLKKLSIRFHDRHYLLILLKKHLIGTLSDSLIELSKEDLKERLKLIEEVLFLQCPKSSQSFFAVFQFSSNFKKKYDFKIFYWNGLFRFGALYFYEIKTSMI